MMDYSIQTLLACGDQLVSMEEIAVCPATKLGNSGDFLLDGAIVWQIGDQLLLSQQHWDEITDLWAYIVNGLEQFLDTGYFHTYFPDQPLRLVFKKAAEGRVAVTVGDRTSVVSRRIFLVSLTEGATYFFKRMHAWFPNQDASDFLAKLVRLRKKQEEQEQRGKGKRRHR